MNIYKITNKKDGKIYIGKTKRTEIQKRWKEHCDEVNLSLKNKEYAKRHAGSRLYEKMIEEGVENFEISLIIGGLPSEKLLNILEKLYIKKWKTTNRKFGYNVGVGGEGGDNLTNNPNLENIRKKISESLKFAKQNKDYLKDPEKKKAWIEKIAESTRKRMALRTPEQKQKAIEKEKETKTRNGTLPSSSVQKQKNAIGVAKYWREHPEHLKEVALKVGDALRGKPKSEEQKRKQRTAMLGRTPWNKKKKK